jgi:ubiquitin-conjugating enzyme E2 J2
MLVALISFMHTNERTVGGVETSDEQKRFLAVRSVPYNLNNPTFQEMFKDHYVKLGLATNPQAAQ